MSWALRWLKKDEMKQRASPRSDAIIAASICSDDFRRGMKERKKERKTRLQGWLFGAHTSMLEVRRREVKGTSMVDEPSRKECGR
jgi:hypothetical protein